MAYAERHLGTWRGKFKTPEGWRTVHAPRGTTWRKAEAQAEAARLEAASLGGELPPKASEALTLGELCRWWLKSWCKPASHGRELSRLKVNVLEHAIGALPLPRVTADVVEARLRELEEEGAAPASVEHLRRTLRTVFNRATKARKWNRNPAAEAHPRSMDPVEETRPLAAAEVSQVVAAIGEPWKRDLVVTAFYTLMRKGELLALRRDALDFDAGTIRVSRSHGRSTTKGGHGDTIPMARALRPYLEHAIEAAGSSTLVFPGPDGGRRPETTDAVAIVRRALRDAGLVEGWEHLCRRCKGRGAPYAERHLEQRPDARCPRCGMRLYPRAIARPFTFHALRHTGASLLASAGVPLHVLQRLLRHRSVDTTARKYLHLYPGEMQAAIERLPELPPPARAAAPAQVVPLAAVVVAGHAPPMHLSAARKGEGPAPVARNAARTGPSAARGTGFEPVAFGSGGPAATPARGGEERQAPATPRPDGHSDPTRSAPTGTVRQERCTSHAPLHLVHAVEAALEALDARDPGEAGRILRAALRALEMEGR